MTEHAIALDGNEAVSRVAYKLSEIIAIYPITPSTPMGEQADEWSAAGRKNLWGTVPVVIEMQSEAGAAGAVHGALQTGALATTFTSSQGLLLMIPDMYKIAGELTPAVFHVAARSLAAQGLSIFGDHSDVMATRSTGWALIASNSPQEAQDFAAIAHASTLRARVPFLHFFDGFRTSHEINKLVPLADDDLRQLLDNELVYAHRGRALSPNHPVIRGTAQNPDVYFQARESGNSFYLALPAIVQQVMDRFAAITGRQYHLFDYAGAPDAERVIVVMGSAAETTEETVKHLVERGEKVGVLKVHLFNPITAEQFLAALPKTVTRLAVLDRTKEPGSLGEPLYLVVVAIVNEGRSEAAPSFTPRIVGGRYGLSSKEFTPAMVKGIFDELAKEAPKNHFTIGIHDDVTHTSLEFDPEFSIEDETTVRCIFWGLGSDGTVGANKNSIKVIGEETDNYAQGYFVYDSKKSGSVTTSHLRFGPKPIRAPYLIETANFVACHQFSLIERFDLLKSVVPGGVFLLNTDLAPAAVWDHLPATVQQALVEKHLRFYVIDALGVTRATGMGGRINTVMQTCFFAISRVLPREQAIAAIKRSIEKTYSKRGQAVVRQNFAAVDQTLAALHEVTVPAQVSSTRVPIPAVPPEAPAFVRSVLGPMIAGEGERLPVSALPPDGTYPTGTAKWEKRSLTAEIPVWDADLCIQCGKCSFVCPHAAIREKVYDPALLAEAPVSFHSAKATFKEFPGLRYTLQVAPEDCTGCALCVEVCPVKDKQQPGRRALNLAPQPPLRAEEQDNWAFFQWLPEIDRRRLSLGTVKNSQLAVPLFEFSGACAGCGETPYIKLVTQLFGDRAVVANATGCSSIYGGNLPTTPWSQNRDGRGPAWANSLFEDNAEFGLGMRLTLDKQYEYARELLLRLACVLDESLVHGLLEPDQGSETGIHAQRERVALLKQRLRGIDDPQAKALLGLADVLVKHSVWIIGGDGWAYDIGFGGLDHVLAAGRNVNILVLDTEGYSNTGGQASKSTPRAAVAKFATRGKTTPKKDLGLLAMAYGNVYVASVAMGASDQQTLRALIEAEAYNGPSLVIAYSHCIAHGIAMDKGLAQQRLAVQSGAWMLYRYNPTLLSEGKDALTIDSGEPTIQLEEYAYNETRYRMLRDSDPERAEELMRDARHDAEQRRRLYLDMAARAQASHETVTKEGEDTGNRQAHAAFCAELPRPGPDSTVSCCCRPAERGACGDPLPQNGIPDAGWRSPSSRALIPVPEALPHIPCREPQSWVPASHVPS